MYTNPMRLLDEDDKDPLFRHKNSYDVNSKIMLTAIISLSLVVLLVIVLHTYARCVLRRQALRQAALRYHLGTSTMAHVHSAEPPKTGLEPSVIASLPMFVFTRADGQDAAEANAIECAVCLNTLEDEEMARLLPNCKHSFHAECIDMWLNSHTTCPICRTQAEPRLLQPEPREGPTPGGPTAPPLAPANSVLLPLCVEGTSEGAQSSSGTKVNGSISRLSSFRRMLSMDRSSRRVQSCGQEDGPIQDLERQ